MLSIDAYIDMMSTSRIINCYVKQRLTLADHELSKRDKRRIYDAYLKWTLVIYDATRTLDYMEYSSREDVNRYGLSRTYSVRNFINLWKLLARLDVGEVMTQLKALLLALRHLSVKKGTLRSTNELFAEFEVSRAHPIVQFLLPIWNYAVEGLDHVRYYYLNTILQYMVRLTLSDVDWIEDEEISSYLAFEHELSCQTYDQDLLSEVRDVITQWFVDFSFEESRPSHGYGATAEVARHRGTEEKYQYMKGYQQAAALAAIVGWDPGTHVYDGLSFELDDCLFDETAEAWRRLPMVYQLVPKGVDRKRGISKEPVERMFFQKMFSQLFDNHFQRKPWMGINLHNQDLSRELCQECSYTYEYGTLDLSSASDSVTNTLVSYAFGRTALGRVLPLLRTDFCQLTYQGKKVMLQLEKFAPMGSAICFPVESTIFAAVCEVVVRRHRLPKNTQWYRVYGDDMIVHRRIYAEVVSLLEQLHFIVNMEKSYDPDADFKEACGMEAFRGFDVSPLRMSRFWDVTQFKRGRLSYQTTILNAAYDGANNAMLKGFPTLRKHIIHQTLEFYPGAEFSQDGVLGFFTRSDIVCRNYKTRYNKDLQRAEIKVQRITSRTANANDDLRYCLTLEEYAYTKRTSLSDPEDRIEVEGGRSNTHVQWVWVPYPI